jgi:hypothetical protein
MKYTVDYFIQKFEAIPENLFCVATRSMGEQRCAYGWCYGSAQEAKASERCNSSRNEEETALSELVRVLGRNWGAGGINNGIYPEYQQPTPKARILAALRDIKKLQQPDHEDITKDLAVLPVDETADIKNTPVLS